MNGLEFLFDKLNSNEKTAFQKELNIGSSSTLYKKLKNPFKLDLDQTEKCLNFLNKTLVPDRHTEEIELNDLTATVEIVKN